jgi:uncharacterized membrane protein (DUF485 family)
MIAALTPAVQAIIGFFTDFFTTITTAPVVEWVIFGVAIMVISFVIGVFKRLVWGNV